MTLKDFKKGDVCKLDNGDVVSIANDSFGDSYIVELIKRMMRVEFHIGKEIILLDKKQHYIIFQWEHLDLILCLQILR